MENTEPKTRRLFVAITVPYTLALELAGYGRENAARAPGMRWTEAEDLHLTLKFLGAVRATGLELLRGRLGEVRGAPFGVSLAAAGFFERAGALVLGVERAEAITRLQERVGQITEPLGFAREERVYRPHITLARRRGHRRAGANERRTQRELVGQLDGYCKQLPAQWFPVGAFALYESSGRHYRVVEEYALHA